jgi:steroid 5-alpha reductase family enzyme
MKRFIAYITIGLTYVLACVVAWVLYNAFAADLTDTFSIIIALFLADVAATIIVWLFGLIFANSSFYDPYWSLIPWLIVLSVMWKFNLWGITNIILLAVTGIWSWRLTINWAYTCDSIKCQDWRYIMYKQNNSPLVWHIINFVGINMMPTVLVYLATIPAILTVLTNAPFNALTFFGAALILIGTLLEYFADNQMHQFRKTNTDRDKVNNYGLWRYSRHPNYFGEITVWFGVYLYMLVLAPAYWYTVVGALAITALFNFVSIPMMEKRQKARRPAYNEYVETTARLIFRAPKDKE